MGLFIDFKYVKSQSSFPAVLQHFNITTKGDGAELRCLCPFHDDHDPSMSVNTEENVFVCHADSCGEKGNILDFVAIMDGLQLREGAQKLAEICGTDLAPPRSNNRRGFRSKTGTKKPARDPDTEKTAKQSRNKSVGKSKPKDDGVINAPLSFSLTLDPDHAYGKTRSLSPAVISQLEMGFCNRGMMKDRWCVPIHNREGDLVAYYGRAIDPDVEEQHKLPLGFKKSHVLFNLHRLAGQTDEVVLVEGVFDTARLHSLAMPGVGLLGSDVSDEQIELLHKVDISRVWVLLDGGAKKAIKRALYRLAPHFDTRLVVLPADDDPASVDEEFLRQHLPVLSG